jgi:hypothetical protein
MLPSLQPLLGQLPAVQLKAAAQSSYRLSAACEQQVQGSLAAHSPRAWHTVQPLLLAASGALRCMALFVADALRHPRPQVVTIQVLISGHPCRVMNLVKVVICMHVLRAGLP